METRPTAGISHRMLADDRAELVMYGIILHHGTEGYDDKIIAEQVNEYLDGLGKLAELRILMASLGGDVDAAFSICNRLDKLSREGQIGEINTVAEGTVGSAATLVFLKGENRIMSEGTRFMIHNPWTAAVGDFRTLARAAARLEDRTAEVNAIYTDASSLKADEVQAAMDAETYYLPRDAVASGFATAVTDDQAIAACGRGWAEKSLLHPSQIEFAKRDSMATVKAKIDALKLPS